jgi:tetratricopeptide (TPR) repeat protein
LSSSMIFCPNGHLVLDAPGCPDCDWIRPRSGEFGQMVWGPIETGGPLGLAGSHSFVGWGMVDQVLVFPRNNGGWIMLSKSNGEVLWQVPLEPGRVIREMVPHKGQLLAAVSDQRDLLKSQKGNLVLIDPKEKQYEVIWEAESTTLTPPVCTRDRIIVRDASRGLVVLNSTPPFNEMLTVELENFSPYPPVIDGGQVVLCDGSMMHSTVRLKGFDLLSGELLWESPPIGSMATTILQLKDGIFAFCPDRRRLMAFSVDEPDKFAWEKNLSKIYSAPVYHREEILVVHRGNKDPDAEDHYFFARIDPISGKTLGKLNLDHRAEQILPISEHQIILSGHNRDYRAFLSCRDVLSGSERWRFSFEHEADPIQTQLQLDDHNFYTGTSSGRIFAFRYDSGKGETPEDPEALLREENYIKAAAIYALEGNYLRAAEIYVQTLNQPEKGLMLLEKGEYLEEAGLLAKGQGWQQQALEYFEAAENQQAQAEMLEAMGDHIGAANLYQVLGDHQKAGKLFEKVGEFVKAFRNYVKVQDERSIQRIALQINALPDNVEINLRDIERCLEFGFLEEAADLAVKIQQWERAAKIYQEMGAAEKEMKTLIFLSHEEGIGKWVFERLIRLGKDLEQFDLVGDAFEKLERYKQAAEAYETAADKALGDLGNKQIAAEFLMKAKICYEEHGQIDELPRINRRIIFLESRPNINLILINLDKPLREEDTNSLTLEILNDGFGIAHDISITVRSQYFEFDKNKIPIEIPRLAPNLRTTKQVFLKPHDHGHVPLDFEWRWKDRHDHQYHKTLTGQIAVRSLDDTRSGQPQIVYATNWIASGDMVNAQGDIVSAGGQKGDRVNMGGSGLSMKGEGLGTISFERPKEEAPTCKKCGRDISNSYNYCDGCGHPL